jgi:hypothetical protein
MTPAHTPAHLVPGPAAPVPGVGSGVWDVVSVFPVGPVCLIGGGAMTSGLKERFLDFAAHD